MIIPKWLEWAQSLHSLAQAGLTYSPNPFDIERYEHIRQIAAEIISTYTRVDLPVIQKVYSEQSGYVTPKVDVRGAVFREDKILLVKELLITALDYARGLGGCERAPQPRGGARGVGGIGLRSESG